MLDSGNNRVVHFGPNHEFLQVWGAGVKTAGEKTYEVCTEANCKAGFAGFGKGQFDEPVAIAVDNAKGSPSKGDVYVVANGTAKKAVIDKFRPSGELIERLLASKEEHEEFEENPIIGVAVGPTARCGSIVKPKKKNSGSSASATAQNTNAPLGVPIDLEVKQLSKDAARPGFAVDGKGDVYVTYEPAGHTLEEREEEEEEIKENEKERKENRTAGQRKTAAPLRKAPVPRGQARDRRKGRRTERPRS